MAKLHAFRGFRPGKKNVNEVASRPYDVLNSEEARIEVMEDIDWDEIKVEMAMAKVQLDSMMKDFDFDFDFDLDMDMEKIE